MGFRFQKRVSLFPGVRLNFSARGISTTIGVRGASINIGSRGTHLNLGLPGTGISFRTKLSGNDSSNSVSPLRSTSDAPPVQLPEQIGAIKSASTDGLTSPGTESLKRLINEAFARRIELRERINRCEGEAQRAERRRRNAQRFIIRLFMKRRIPTLILSEQTTKERLKQTERELESCSIRVDFDLDDAMNNGFAALTRAFDETRTCISIWDVTGSVEINRAAERTIAANSIMRERVQLDFVKSEVIESDQPPLNFENANGDELFFYPGLLLVKGKGGDFGLIEYTDLQIEFRESIFIEEEDVPSDAKVIGNTWKRTNKDGSPDRRFSDNFSIPLVRYGKLCITSSRGLNEAYLFSNFSKASRFATGLLDYQKKVREFLYRPQGPAEPFSPEPISEGQEFDESNDEAPETPPSSSTIPDWLCLIAIVYGIAALFFTAPDWLDRAKAFLPQTANIIPSSGTPASRPPSPETSRPSQPPTAPSSAPLPTSPTQVQRNAPTTQQTRPAVQPRELLYVQKHNVNVRAAPSMNAAIVTYAYRGRRVTIFQRQGDWIQIGDEQPVGWMHSSFLSSTPPQ